MRMLSLLFVTPGVLRPRRLVVRHLNRLFLERDEVAPRVELAADDRRAAHVREVLWRGAAPPPGARVRVGALDGGVGECGASLGRRGAVVLEDVPPSLAAEAAPRPRVDLVLALPAPLRLKRLLPAVASLGVDNLWLVGTRKTEKAYFGAAFLRDLPARAPHQRTVRPAAVAPGKLRDLLVEGAEQSGDAALPRVALCRSLRACLPEVDRDALRIAAHPDRGAGYEALDDATGAMVAVPRARKIGDVVCRAARVRSLSRRTSLSLGRRERRVARGPRGRTRPRLGGAGPRAPAPFFFFGGGPTPPRRASSRSSRTRASRSRRSGRGRCGPTSRSWACWRPSGRRSTAPTPVGSR